MNIQISGRNIELTEALKANIHSKAEKLKHHVADILSLSVVLSIEKSAQIAEANAKVAGFEAHAIGKSPDMYQSIDLVMEKLQKQFLKHKEK